MNNLENEKQPIGEETTDKIVVVENNQEVTDTPLEEKIAHAEETVAEEVVTKPVEESADNASISESEAIEEAEDAESKVVTTALSIEEIVLKLRELLESSEPQRKEIAERKSQFYHLLRLETEKQKQAFLLDGGEEIDFVAQEDALISEGKNLLSQLNEKRAKLTAVEEAEKESNVIKKQAVIDRIKELTEQQGQEDFNKLYQEFNALQTKWNEIKAVPQAKVNELWKSYQLYVEKFYDLVRINNEFREYDFKKNLKLKTDLCEKAEKLLDENDVVSAFYQLQNLHQEWREIGPVARADREDIWTRFKNASSVINKNYQAYFEKIKQGEDENLAIKTKLCEQLEAIDCSEVKTVKAWNAKMKEVQAIQAQWKEVGYAPKKWSNKIYERFRAAGDKFYKAKSEYYKTLRGDMDENLKKKIALCERAEALKDSQDWRKTSQEMVEIQKEWKTIGTVPNKHVDSVWKRFIAACDHFFEQKKLNSSSKNDDEAKNLLSKKEVIDKIKTLDTSDVDQALVELKQLVNSWSTIGHVPFKLKDKVYKEFSDASDEKFNKLNVDKADRMLENFKSSTSEMAKAGNAKTQILRERDKLMRQFERMKSELQTYENNIGFLSISSKKGNSLLDDMNQKVEKIKSELALLVKKIEVIDNELL